MCTSLTYSRASVALASALNVSVLKPSHFVKSTLSAARSSKSIGHRFPASKIFVRSIEQASSQQASPQLTLFPEVTPASRFPRRGSGAAKQMTATSGLKCLGSSKNCGLLGSLERMLLGTFRWGSTKCWLIWKVRTTPRGHLVFRLVPSAPTMNDNGYGLLPTLTVHGNYNRKGMSKKSGDGLVTALARRLLPTLIARDSRTFKGNVPPPGHMGGISLTQTLGGTLNPYWTEVFMGYPVGWTELNPSEIASIRSFRKSSATRSRKG